ncbi:hypothetical protein DEU56DRAFT_326532 [Suillus clintonianus]|uniref:uncharacterized protein n=1 Tax=Suillus clintonianus TaxID=1904413 RepID=UPI001B862A43|nr:uncharacterized protein DEU56DRAFT_326532 [Suillus clintonianus]KAG2139321.1 hypothetical protein DEU56DRAFT_326532 [Suillus clintonianus]
MDQRAVVDSQASEKYLRIASISIALYDYVITLPAEWRFYRSQSSIFHLSFACILFILIRYVSITVMLVSNYGVFSTSFTQETCQHYYIVAPIFKVLQTIVSQVILGVRTFNIARRNRRTGIALALVFFVSITLEWFTNMFSRIPVSVNGNCTPGNAGKTLSAWLYYVTAMMYDLVMLTISTTHLLQYSVISSRLERVVRVLMYDGIGYFIVLTGSNILNITLYRESDVQTQSAGASIGYAVTWIMSQQILIHLREMQEAPRTESVVLARPAQSARNVMSGFRSKSDADFVTSPRNAHGNNDVELDIRVCVERSVVVDYTDESEHSRSIKWQDESRGLA